MGIEMSYPNDNHLVTANSFSAEEDVIDLREVYFALKKRFWVILATGLFFACAAAAVTIFLMTPLYQSTASVLVLSKETTLTSIADLQLGTQLTNDYEVLITSTSVLEQVIVNLGLDVETEELRSSVTVKNPQDTRILDITVENPDPIMAKRIADEVAAVSASYVGDKMEVIPPKIIENAKIPTVQSSPSLRRNVMIAFLAGLMLAGGVVVLLSYMDDTIKNEDDLARYLGISLLASVPDRKDYINTKGKRK